MRSKKSSNALLQQRRPQDELLSYDNSMPYGDGDGNQNDEDDEEYYDN